MSERIALDSAGAGLALGQSGRYSESLAALDAAVAEDPRSRDAWYNRGVTLARLGRPLDALLSYDRAVALDGDYAEGWKAHGNALVALGQFRAAAGSYQRARDLDPGLPYLLGALAHAKRMLCDWDGLADLESQIADGIRAGRPVAHAGGMLGSALPPELQRGCIESYVAQRYPAAPERPAGRPWRGQRRRLRIGYLSGDLASHPVGYQMQALARHHDRSRIEAHAISLQARDDPYQHRIRAAIEHFADVGGLDRHEIVQRVRSWRLDIVLDLQGHTQNSRLDLLAAGLAPVQLNYLCPSTSGASFLDGIVADTVVVPGSHEAYYTERVHRVPVSVFIADYGDTVLPPPPSRESQGLRRDAVVLASFAESYKLTRDVWTIWMRLLARHPDCVLWLGVRSGPDVAEDLRRRAIASGIAPDRIVLAPYASSREAHLARLSLADLGLDTHLYNGHTTTADLLRAGVPVLTSPSQTYAGRLGASIVTAAGLPELVAPDLLQYERTADRSIADAGWRRTLRSRLANPPVGATLFDPALSVRRLEEALLALADARLP